MQLLTCCRLGHVSKKGQDAVPEAARQSAPHLQAGLVLQGGLTLDVGLQRYRRHGSGNNRWYGKGTVVGQRQGMAPMAHLLPPQIPLPYTRIEYHL